MRAHSFRLYAGYLALLGAAKVDASLVENRKTEAKDQCELNTENSHNRNASNERNPLIIRDHNFDFLN